MASGVGVEQFDSCKLLPWTSGLLLEPPFQIVCGSARERRNGAGGLFEVIVKKCCNADGLFEKLVEAEFGLRTETTECELINVLQQSESFSSVDADHGADVLRWRREVLEWRVKCCGDGVLNE